MSWLIQAHDVIFQACASCGDHDLHLKSTCTIQSVLHAPSCKLCTFRMYERRGPVTGISRAPRLHGVGPPEIIARVLCAELREHSALQQAYIHALAVKADQLS